MAIFDTAEPERKDGLSAAAARLPSGEMAKAFHVRRLSNAPKATRRSELRRVVWNDPVSAINPAHGHQNSGELADVIGRQALESDQESRSASLKGLHTSC